FVHEAETIREGGDGFAVRHYEKVLLAWNRKRKAADRRTKLWLASAPVGPGEVCRVFCCVSDYNNHHATRYTPRRQENLSRLTRLTRLTHLPHLRYLTRLTRNFFTGGNR